MICYFSFVVIDCIEVMSGYRLARVPHIKRIDRESYRRRYAVESNRQQVQTCEIPQSKNHKSNFAFLLLLATRLLSSFRR